VLAEQTDDLNGHGDVLMDLVEVFELVGEGRDVVTVFFWWVRVIYLCKGNLVMVECA